MITLESRTNYDNFGTGNYTEDKSKRCSISITQKQAEQYVDSWIAAGFVHYETSKAHFFEIHEDARHYIQLIVYK